MLPFFRPEINPYPLKKHMLATITLNRPVADIKPLRISYFVFPQTIVMVS